MVLEKAPAHSLTADMTNKHVLDHIKPDIFLEGEHYEILLYFMMCDQTHWRRQLCSEWSAVKVNEVTPKICWLDTVKANTSQSIKQLTEAVQDWEMWRELVHRAADN